MFNLFTMLALIAPAPIPNDSPMTSADLRCEYRVNPLGIDDAKPRLSWTLRSTRRGEVQTGYQVLVATTSELLSKNKADLWDSGKHATNETFGIEYAGRKLPTGQRAYWKVRVWDRDGKPSRYSAAAWWEMGWLGGPNLSATWIGSPNPLPTNEADFYNDHPAPLLRKEFVLAGPVKRARAYVTGLGYYEMRLNGAKVGDHVLDPGWTDYSKRIYYSTYDVTSQLQSGKNAVGIMLGNGWYNPLPLRLFGRFNRREWLPTGRPRALMRLEIEYADGRKQSIVTDPTWRVSDGPILRNDIYLGEVYDARREQSGWDRAGFSDAGWKQAVPITEPVGPLQAQFAPPIRITRTLKPAKVSSPSPGTYIVDMGQNYAGWITLRMQGEAGRRVTLRFGELLNADGTLNIMTSSAGQIKAGWAKGGPGAPATADQRDVYICKGGPVESYTPRFTWHGFRYVELTGLSRAPELADVTGHRLNSDVEKVGTFSSSNELFNRIQEVVEWTQLSNMFSVQSDCPHRERLGYGGDIVAASEMGFLNWDISRFYAKAVDDLKDAVRPNGGFTETSPFVGIADEGLGEGSGPIGWGTASPLLQWQLYQYSGDKRILTENYPLTRKWIALLRSRAKDHILVNGISDHESLVPKPVALTGTAFYYFNVRLAERCALALGQKQDAAEFGALALEIANAFHARFYHPETGAYDAGTQACQAFALYFGLVPPAERPKALAALVRDIEETHKGHLTTGIFGTKYMLEALTRNGRADVAYSVADQKEFPGWGYMLSHGATTLWEHWDYDDRVYSHNHPMFGSVSEWFYKGLVGIRPAEDAVGFNHVEIVPYPFVETTHGVDWAKGSYRSVRGTIKCEWRRQGNGLVLDVTIPPNVRASVVVPTSDPASVTEQGTPVAKARGVNSAHPVSGGLHVEIGSGTYEFSSIVQPRNR